MRQVAVVILSFILSNAGLWAQSAAQDVPQTARQALMEMFFSKQPGTFLKHLPAATRTTLEKSGALADLQQYSMLAAQLPTQGKSFQTFGSGPLMFAAEDPKTHQKIEIAVANDSLQGDQDDIELAIRTYKNNEAQKTPYMPRIIFSMKKEAGLWSLNEIDITIRLPLADPDLLKSISEGMKARASAAGAQSHGGPQAQSAGRSSGGISINAFGSEANVLAAMHKILAAENTYAANYSAVGYTCTLSDLDGFGAGEANEHQAMLISSGLASGKNQGYNFSLTACDGRPATSFRLTATPMGDSYGRRAFCTDQSGAIRASADGSVATCLSSGTMLP